MEDLEEITTKLTAKLEELLERRDDLIQKYMPGTILGKYQGGVNHFVHLVNNMLNLLSLWTLSNNTELKLKRKDMACAVGDLLDKYFILLEEFPEFRKGEFLTDETAAGYFGNLLDEETKEGKIDWENYPGSRVGKCIHEVYILESEKRLRN